MEILWPSLIISLLGVSIAPAILLVAAMDTARPARVEATDEQEIR